MAAVWTPWAWAGSDDEKGDQGRQRHQRRSKQQQRQQQRPPQPHPSPVLRPRSAPASAPERKPTTISLQLAVRRPELDDATTLDDDDTGSPPSTPFYSLRGKGASTGDLTLRASDGGGMATRGALDRDLAPNRRERGEGRGLDGRGGGQRRGEAAPPSPDFRRLGPSSASSNSLAGWDFNDLTEPSAVAGNSENKNREGRGLRPEVVGAKSDSRLSPSNHKGDRNRCYLWRKQKKRQGGACHPPVDTDNERNALDFSFPAGTGGTTMYGDEKGDGGERGSGGVGFCVVGVDGDGGGGGDVRAGLHLPRRYYSQGATLPTPSRAPSLSVQSSPSSPQSGSRRCASSPTALPEEEPCGKEELEEARRAVSSRLQRRRVCSAFRAHEPASAGMAAAQRAYRGAFVVNKMGDAKARSTWRP